MKKKLITGILATLACAACFAACGQTNNGGSSSASGLTDAKAYLNDMYKSKDVETREDYTVVNSLAFDGATYTIEWSVDVTEGVTVVPGDKTVTIDVDEEATADIAYVLTATIKDAAGNTETLTFNRTVLKAPSVVPSAITAAPVEGTAYKLYMRQVTKKSDQYFTGKMSGDYYLATTNASQGETYLDATDVYVEAVDGKAGSFYLTFTDSTETKKYIGVKNVYVPSGNYKGYHDNVFLSETTTVSSGETATFEFTYSETYGTMVATLEGVKSGKEETTETKTVTYFLGTSGTFYTFGAMDVADITKTDACVGKLVTMVDKSTITDEVKVEFEKAALEVVTAYNAAGEATLPTAGTTYTDVAIAWSVETNAAVTLAENVLTVSEVTKETTVVLTATLTIGEEEVTQTFTLTLTPPPAVMELAENTAYKFYITQVKAGKTIYVTGAVSGRYLATTENVADAADVYAEIVDDGYKFYIVVEDAKQYVNIYNNDDNKLSVNFAAETACVFAYDTTTKCWYTNFEGTDYYLGTYNTFNTVSASKTSYITAENTGVEQFPATFLEAETASSEVKENVAYKFYLTQVTLDKTLYVTGAVSGRYLSTSETASEGADIYAENVNCGYKFYTIVEEAKQYLNIYFNSDNKISVNFVEATDCVFAYNATTKCWYTNVDGTDYYLGTYNNFNTVSASKTSYITAENTGVSQFPANFVAKTEVENDEAATPAGTTYTFSNYTAGVQYAENEAHVLDEIVTVTTWQAHFTGELRLYSSSEHNGYAIISSTKVINSITVNAGNKADTLNVYGSTDGTTWTLIQGITTTSTYTDYTVAIANSQYKYLKLDVAGDKQIRIKSMTLVFAE